MNLPYNTKSISQEITDLDDSKGIVVAYANVYGLKDSDGDISAPNSFKKTVPEQYDRIGVFKNHNPNISIGIPLDIDANDNYGLKTVTKFDLSIPDGKNMYNHIKFKAENKRNTELSIGYEIIKRDTKNRSIITEYKLWEYSFLTHWGANKSSLVQEVKSMITTPTDVLDALCKMYDTNYSDERLRQIETILKSLSNEPSKTDTHKDEPITAEQLKNELLTLFN